MHYSGKYILRAGVKRDHNECPMTGIKNRTNNFLALVFTLALICLMTITIIPGVRGEAAVVDLGSAGNFAILAKTGITDSLSSSVITGNVGLSPGLGGAIKGFDDCGRVSGTIYRVDDSGTACATNNTALVNAAVTDMISAYSVATSESPDFSTPGAENIAGRTLTPGAYAWTGAVSITGNDVTLDGQGNTNAVWILRTTGALTIDAGKKVVLINGAQPSNIFWVVAGDTALGANSVFKGNILDAGAITLGAGAALNGRAFAQSAVTLGGSTLTLPIPVVAPIADFTFTNATGTVPLTVAFTDASSADPSGSIRIRAWDFGDGATATVQNPVHTYGTAGTYTVNLTVTDSYGATATKLGTVTVNPASVADFTFTNATGTAPLYVAFTDASTPVGQIASWAWDFGDGGSSSDTNPVYTYVVPGTYSVNLTVTDVNGECSTKIQTITATLQPSLEITVTNIPFNLTLNHDQTTTNTEIQFYVNSSTNWQITAYDADPSTNGHMTRYSGTQYDPGTRLIEPFMVRQNSNGMYVNLPTSSSQAILTQTGAPEDSVTPYPLGIQQNVKMADAVLPGNTVYRIVVTLTLGST